MPPRHWLHPQAVPRGFLRLYILTLLSKGPRSGYSIIQSIDEKTEGAWRPGPGSMYPLLKSLEREGLVQPVRGKGRITKRGESKTYRLTTKGSRELEQVGRLIEGAGRKEAVVGRLFSDLLPGDVFVAVTLRRLRYGTQHLRQKFAEVPYSERGPLLQELRLVAASLLDWIDSELAAPRKVKLPSRP